MRFLPRVGFALLVSMALGTVLGSCTHRGTPAPVPSQTAVPTSRIVYVNAKTGNDKNNGSQTTPYKTVTRALAAVASPGPIPVQDIEIASGDYNVANGEKFPLQIPATTVLTINGSLYGRGQSHGAFIDGAGEDTVYEKIVDAPAGTYYTTVEIGSVATGITMTNLYVGAAAPKLPLATTQYHAVDLMGVMTGTTSSFDAPPKAGVPRLNGILVPGGTLTCTSCAIGGTGYAIAAFSLADSTCPSTQCPAVTLSGASGTGQGSVAGSTGIRTDGTATIIVSNQSFSSSTVAFADDYPPMVTGGVTPVNVDFGQGPESPNSSGGNVFIGAKKTEISLGLANEEVTGFGDTWTPNVQGSGPHGVYKVDQNFDAGKSGMNFTIADGLANTRVRVGPFKQATPTPSTSPSTSPSGSASASPTTSASASPPA
jgi:Protein of unknown function (DUF1565)